MNVILIAAITADGYIARHSNEIVEWSLDLQLFKEQYKKAEKGLPNFLEEVVNVMVKKEAPIAS